MEGTKDFFKASNKSISASYKKNHFGDSKENKINFTQKSNKINSFSRVRQTLLELTKNEIKQSNELIIKSYKEDLEIEKLVTNDSMDVIKTNNENDDDCNISPELNSEDELELAYLKNKYAGKDCSSSNLSD